MLRHWFNPLNLVRILINSQFLNTGLIDELSLSPVMFVAYSQELSLKQLEMPDTLLAYMVGLMGF